MAERSAALLLAVLQLVDKLNEEAPKHQKGGGNVVRWPTVVATLEYLQPTACWTKSTAEKTYRPLKHLSEEARVAEIERVPDIGLRDIVEEIRRTGKWPSRPAPLMDGINFNAAAVKQQMEEATLRIPPSRSESPDERVQERKAEMLRQHDRKVAQALVDQAALTDLLVDAAIKGAKAAPPVQIRVVPTVIMKPDTPEEIPNALLGDIHGGALVTPEEVGGLGEFNWNIFVRRLNNYQDRIVQTIDLHRKGARISRMVIWMLGDMIEGEVIFDGQAYRIEMITVDQVFDVSSYLVGWLLGILASGLVETIDVICIPGNHGRTTHKKGATKFHGNWDYVVYRHMAEVLKNEPRIKWFIPKTWFAIVEMLGFRVYGTHGDVIKAWMGIPYYGIQRHDSRTTTLLQTVDLDYQYWVCGDKHVSATIPRVKGAQIMNGSIVGGSDFSMHQLGTASEPMQTMFGLREGEGKSWQYDFILDRREPADVRKALAFTQI